MRPIKFRAWSKKDSSDIGHMITWERGLSRGAMPDLEESERWKVMQFTGLHDKNGKEIYEGDIIRLEKIMSYKVREIMAVEWMPATGFCPFNLDAGYANSCEVIGNIYENKELLK